MNKICFFATHFDPARQVIIDYYERIFPPEIEIFIYSMQKISSVYKFKRANKIEPSGKKFLIPLKLRKFCKENKIDCLITLTDSPEVALTTFYATIFSKTKNDYYIQGSPTITLGNSSYLFFQFFMNKILSCSKEVSENLKKYLFFSKKKIFYLPHPINIFRFFPQSKRKAREKLKLNNKDNIISYIGRIEEQQGSDILLPLIINNPDKYFILIGKIKDKNFLNLKLKNLKIIPFIKNKELVHYYNASDLFIFLSKRNSYPFPPRESLACEIPVLVLDIEAFKSIKSPAVLKSKMNIKDVQRKVDHFFSLNEKEKKKLGKEGRNFIIEDSSEEKIKDKTIKILLEQKIVKRDNFI